MLVNLSKFHLQKSVWYFKPPIESYKRNSRGCLKMSKNGLSNPSLKFVYSFFYWRIEISNKFIDVKFNLIQQLFTIRNFIKKKVLLYLNEVWNSTSNQIPTLIDLTMSGRTPTNFNLHCPHCLFHLSTTPCVSY